MHHIIETLKLAVGFALGYALGLFAYDRLLSMYYRWSAKRYPFSKNNDELLGKSAKECCK